jgi:hypothetical protein
MEDPKQVRWEDIRTALSGQSSQEVSVSQYVLKIDAVQGGVIQVAPSSQPATEHVRPRRSPPIIMPRPVQGFLDREQEQSLIGGAMARGQVVDLHGPDGMGKTSLISQVMRAQAQLPSRFPDGMVYLSARYETGEDLLQTLFGCFYETVGHVKVTSFQVRRYMSSKRALIAVDDVNQLEESEANELVQSAPLCVFLIAGREPKMREGTGVPLRGLPKQAAVTLFERHWGRLSAQDRPIVELICDALDSMPLAIINTAKLASQHRLPLPQLLQQVRSSPEQRDSKARLLGLFTNHLSEEEKRVLGALAAPGGTTVGIEALPAITGLPEDKIARYLARLQELGLVQAHSPRYSVNDAFRPEIQRTLVDEETLARSSDFYRQKALNLQLYVRNPDEENIMATLEYCFRRKEWKHVVELARTIEIYLISTGQWGRLKACLARARGAARELGDWGTEAWAQNQLGMLAAWEGETGLEETQQNLQMLADMLPRSATPDGGKVLTILPSAPYAGATLPAATSKRRHLDTQIGGGESTSTMYAAEADVEVQLQPRGLSSDDTSGGPYNLAAIRRLLTAAFTPQSLRRFCQDHLPFQPVGNDLSPQHSLNDMVDRLVDYCRIELLWDELLATLKEEHSRQYARFESELQV